MSFLSGLLRRELPAAPAPSRPDADSGTTPAGAVVPRLPSRFEAPDAPRWPGGDAIEQFANMPGDDAGPGGNNNTPGQGLTGKGAAMQKRGWLAAQAKPSVSAPASAAPATESVTPPGWPDGGHAVPAMPLPESVVVPASHSIRPADTHNGVSAELIPELYPAQHASAGTLQQANAGNPADTGKRADTRGHPARQDDVVRSTWNPWQQDGTAPGSYREGQEADAWALRPRLEPLSRPEPARPPEQHVHVSIGRIEVRTVAAPPAPHHAPEQPGLMSLDDYLKSRP